MQEVEDDDNGTVILPVWKRIFGYVSEFQIDARWVMYYDGDTRPHGSLRIVSHPDLPPGYLKSYVSLVNKRRQKTDVEIAKTLETYGLLNDNDYHLFNGIFYKKKTSDGLYVWQGRYYKNKKYTKNKQTGKTTIHYLDPIDPKNILMNEPNQLTHLKDDELSIITYTEPLTQGEVNALIKSVSGDLDAYNVIEQIESWDNETVDTLRNLEKLYNVKIFS